MKPDLSSPLFTLGLGGDGDEIDAIEAVERCFGVTLDATDAQNWVTVDNVFKALTVAQAISQETDVDPRRVSPETRLLA